MKKVLLLNILVIFCLIGNAQKIGFDSIDDKKVSAWKTSNPSDYQYVYHFGDSEMESDFVLIYVDGNFYGQIKSGSWGGDESPIWVWNYNNLLNIKVEGNKFYSDKSNGEFVIYDNGKEKIYGLKVYNSWSGLTEKGEYEIGTKSYEVKDYFSGKYTQASKRILSKEELSKISRSELQIMRNEIFARYGYIFIAGGKMDIYFKNQKWYRPMHKNVDAFLTEVEKENIKLIQEIEKTQ